MSRFMPLKICCLCAVALNITLSMPISAQVPTTSETTPQPAKSQDSKGPILIADPDLSTFVMAIRAAELSDIFNGTGPFTAFIPSNAAFDKFGKVKLKELLKPENKDQLVDILIYHIVPGKYMAENLKSKSYRTVNGKPIEVTNENGQISVNNAKVIRTDLAGPNGVIHEIDTVLIP